MNNTSTYKPVYLVFFTLLFMAGVVLSVFSTPYFLLLPFGLLFCLWSIQSPQALLFILFLSIPWAIEYTFSQSLGTDLPDEPLMLLTSFSVISYGILHRKSGSKVAALHPILFLIYLQIAWMLVTTMLSSHLLISVKYMLAKGWYLLAFIGAPLIVFKESKWLKRISLGIAISMFLLVVVTMIRHALNGFTFASINESLEPFFRNHVNYSAVLVFTIPVFFSAYLLSNKKSIKILLAFVQIILLAALYLSYARGAWLALIVGILACVLLKRKLLLPAFLFFLLVLFSGFFWLQNDKNYLKFAHHYETTIFHKNFEEHLVATYQLQDVSTAERFYRWVAGVRMSADKWATGFGPNTFYENYKSYAVPAFKTWVSDNPDHSTVHNYFLLTFIEQGIIGFILLMVLIGSFMGYAQKIYHQIVDPFWKTVVATNAVIFTMICTVNFLSDLVETDKVGSFFYVCLALMVVSDLQLKKEKKDRSSI